MGPLLLAIALVAYNSVANRWPPFHSWAYVPSNVVLAALALAVGSTVFGLSTPAMGLWGRSAWAGVAIGAAVMIPVYGMLGVEWGRAKLRDERLAGVRGGRAAFMLVVRIPVGTALVEEVLFRGVLLGSLLAEGKATAIIVSSVAFGLWHVVPTAILAGRNRLPSVVVPLGVVATGIAGAFLSWLRLETGGIIAGTVLHAIVNVMGAGAAMIALRDKRA